MYHLLSNIMILGVHEDIDGETRNVLQFSSQSLDKMINYLSNYYNVDADAVEIFKSGEIIIWFDNCDEPLNLTEDLGTVCVYTKDYNKFIRDNEVWGTSQEFYKWLRKYPGVNC